MIKKFINKLRSIKKIENDSFISRLRATIIGEGMLHEGNIYLINYAIKNMPKKGFALEIGTYGGLSTNLILHLLKKHDKTNKLIGCDAWIYEGYNDNKGKIENFIDGRRDINRIDYMNYIKNSFIRSTKLLHPNSLPYICHIKSDGFFEKWNNNEELTDVFNRKIHLNHKISFAYIDGDHSYRQTKKDFENVSKFLIKGGFILVDDSADYLNFGSVKYVRKIKSNSNFMVVAKNPNYLFQKIK